MFNWEESAFLGYMVEQYEREQEEESDEEEDSSDEY